MSEEGKLKKRIDKEFKKFLLSPQGLGEQTDFVWKTVYSIIDEAKKDILCRVFHLKSEQIDEEFIDALRLQVDSLKEIKAETGLTVNSEWLLWFFDWFMGDKKEMNCLTCGHPRSKHRKIIHHGLEDVKGCTVNDCRCDKFYPEKFSYLGEKNDC